MADERALDMMQAARPDVRREVLADFLAGRIARTPYLHVDPDEFRRMAAWGGNATTRTLELVAEWLEAHAHQEPDLKRIAELARKFGSLGISEAEGAIQAWFEAKPA